MSNLADLKERARSLLEEGHSPGQIADELSLSTETVTWLLTQSKGAAAPRDVHIDWTAISCDSTLLESAASMMIDHYSPPASRTEPLDADVIVGIAISGVPLATLISAREGCRLAVYHPAKHAVTEKPIGSISGNFAQVKDKRCIIVDDVITSGKTLHEVVAYLRRHGGIPVAVWVLFDKRGITEVDGVSVYSLFRVSRID
ncbi:MAG: orotate phosphoribosyltransferase-like protein [Methanocalculus sp. MSAO_Arc1]|uniref:orotate phosphoribosyltransferase-like protein n=1 Tax=Methanocalculus TaxID=71151 RepID=UPI000FF39B0E|nr:MULTISPECIES: orotate phosphoribosyltransferase-like protein [unclassified Methanocalculus]MCP1661395.1 orotate phosphoribosyltransferase [Methanocalculus sp. AMF5]RQD79701.1 MAG: orotate phosphoribosyltransferase-like protein [Methanocalculus sp. MSAO_Arc1]